MSIAQKIFELRRAIRETHPDANLVSIELTGIAEQMWQEELSREYGVLASAPVEWTHVPRRIKKIFDVRVELSEHKRSREDD